MAGNARAVPPAENTPETADLFDAFISYRRLDGSRHARRLRSRLQRFKINPALLGPGRPHKLSIYVDRIYERAEEDFFENTIKPALRRSRHLIVVQTPAATLSRGDGSANWVEREIAYFASLPQGKNISVALAKGEFGDPLPGQLHQVYENIERVDIRRLAFEGIWASDNIIPFIARLYDVPASQMPELRREEAKRRQRRRLFTAVSGLTLVSVLTALLAWAVNERRIADAARQRAEMESRLAMAREIIAAEQARVQRTPSSLYDALGRATEAYEFLRQTESSFADARIFISELLTRIPVRAWRGQEPANSPPGGAVAFSADGSRFAIAPEEGRVLVWRPSQAGGYEVGVSLESRNNGERIQALTFRAEDREIAAVIFNTGRPSFSDESAWELRVWDAHTGRTKRTHALPVTTKPQFSGDGSRLALIRPLALRGPSEAVFVEVDPYRQLKRVPVADEGSAALDYTGSVAAVTRDDGSVEVWRMDGSKTIRIPGMSANMVKLSQDGSILAAGSSLTSVQFFSLNSFQSADACGRVPSPPGEFTDRFDLSRSGEQACVAMPNGAVRIYDLGGNEVKRICHKAAMAGCKFRPDGQAVLSIDRSGAVALSELRARVEATPGAFHPGSDAIVSPDGELIAFRAESGVEVWSLRTRSKVHSVADSRGPLRRFEEIDYSFSPDSRRLMLGAKPPFAVVAVNSASKNDDGNTFAKLMEAANRIPRLQERPVFSPSNDRFAVLTGQQINVYDGSGAALRTLQAEGAVMKAQFSPNGSILAAVTVGNPWKLLVFRVADGELKKPLIGQKSVADLAFARNGRYLATVDHATTHEAGACHVWDTATWQNVSSIRWPDLRLRSGSDTEGDPGVAIDPSGRYAACYPKDDFVHVWEIAESREVARFRCDRCFQLAFTEDLAIATVRGQLHWRGRSLTDEVCTRLTQLGVDTLFVRGGCNSPFPHFPGSSTGAARASAP